ncbi:MAG: T9SS type A sorting domain-containing protein [Bacteroidales bacterium]|nr:T9SS type A sorting domain-containing protein [Bacteroidales bacterium]
MTRRTIILFKFFFIIYLFLFPWYFGYAQNPEKIFAASCTFEDVQAAVALAQDGDTVMIPAGNCMWTEALIIDPMPSIFILGAGIDQTVIIDSTGTGWMQAPFWINGIENKPFRISNITFEGRSSEYGAICIRGACKNFRVDSCEFDDLVGRGIMVAGYSFGVIDHCIFRECRQGASPGCDGEDSWNRPLTLGSQYAVYIEDCYFDYRTKQDGAIDAYDGARYVFRHNQVHNTGIGHHGTCGGTRSTFSYEIYENTIESDETLFRAVFLRGGTGVVFNNTFTNYYVGISTTNYRTCHNEGIDCPNYGRCDGTNPLDGNTPGMMGYPCFDQVGRSTFQGLEPLFAWNNTLDDENAGITVTSGWPECSDPSPFDHIQENRDFYNDSIRPGYKPYIYPHPLVQQWPSADKTDLISPEIPQDLTAEAISENQIKLEWDTVTDDGGSGLGGYYIWENGQRITSNSDPACTTYFLYGLSPGQNYTFNVSAFDLAGNESDTSSSATIATPNGTDFNLLPDYGINVFFNPLHSELTIESDNNIDADFELYNLCGIKVIRQRIHSARQVIDLSRLPSGMYLYKISNRNQYGKYQVLMVNKIVN